MYFFIEEPKPNSQSDISLSSTISVSIPQQLTIPDRIAEEENITTQEYFSYIKEKFMATWDFRLFIFNTTIVKVLNYSFLFWYPTYLFIQGF